MAKKVNTSNHLMSQLASKYETYKTGFFFPTDDIDPKEKKGDWCLQWQQAIWSLFVRNGCYSAVDDYQKFQLLRLYGAGRQPNNIYMDTLLFEDESLVRSGWLSTNWEVFSPMSKFKRIIRGRLESQEYNYVVEAADPASQDDKNEKKWQIWYDSQYGKKEQEVMNTIGAQVDQQMKYIARSLEELEVFQGMGGLKLKKEAALETVLETTDSISDIGLIKEKVLDDLVDLNRAAFYDYYDPVTGLTKYCYADWEYLILDYSVEHDFNKGRFWAYVKMETINDIRAASGLSEDELMQVAKSASGLWGNTTLGSRWAYNNYTNEKGVRLYNQFRIPVLVSEWLSTDSEYKTLKIKRTGQESYLSQEYGKMINTETKKTKITQVNNVYQSNWIIGSKFVYEDGLSLNTARVKEKEPRLSIHAVVLPGKSITESIKPNLDAIALAWYRRQSAIAQASPAGLDFDLSAMEEVSLDGETLSVWEQIKLKRQTGDTFHRSVNLKGKYANNGKPINRNEGGIGTFYEEILSEIDLNFKLIADITGIDLISGATQKPGEPPTATEINRASAATSDALQPLFTSWVRMKEDAAKTATCKIQRAIKYHPEAKETYLGILGKVNVEVLEEAADIPVEMMGITIELKSTEQMKQAAIQAATQAMQPGKDGGGITLSEWYYFVDMINRGRAKYAMALLKFKEEQNKADSLKLQQENMKENRITMMSVQEQKDKMELIRIALKGNMEMRAEAMKALLTMHIGEDQDTRALMHELIKEALIPPPTVEQPQNTAAA